VETTATHALPPAGNAQGSTRLRSSVDDVRRAALMLISQHGSPAARGEAVDRFGSLAIEQVVHALIGDNVDQLLLESVATSGLAERLPAELLELLKARRLLVAAEALRQQHALAQAVSALEEAGIPHVVLKGALLRPLLYAKPSLRPAVDVDLLVARADASSGIRRLRQHGFAAAFAGHSDTHEAWLSRHGVGIDLHWSLLRPGRMRQDITAEILANRVRRGELWSPSDTHLTLAMLVHPAITDHVTGKLISAVDLDRWLRLGPVLWDAVLEVLDRIGLRTAAWAMLRWTTSLFASPVPEEVMAALAPSRLRQRYLEAWLERHPAKLYGRWPNLVRAGFSLALQDRPSDAARALWRILRKHRPLAGQT
jgi:hypothetical protein